MSNNYIVRGETGDAILHYTHFKSIAKFGTARRRLAFWANLCMLPSFFFSPFLFFFSFLTIMAVIWSEVIYEFFYDKRRYDKYSKMFQPKTASAVMTTIGYQVFPEELEEHLGLVGDRTEQGRDKLAAKQKQMMRPENRYRWVGLDKKILTTHLLMPGKTGAGKTEGIRSIADDVLKLGGGFLMNDGKSDEKMFNEFQQQVKAAGRETSAYALNFMKSELMGESNTFSPLGIMHPAKIVEFFGSLIGGGEGDGNARYFFNQGKAMLFPVVNATYIRDKYFKEGFTIEKVFDNTSVINISILYVALYSMCRDIDEDIGNAPRLSVLINQTATIATSPHFAQIEKTIEYVTQNPTQIESVKEAGLTFVEIKEIYSNSFSLMQSYMKKVWNQYGPMLEIVARVVFLSAREEGFRFFADEGVGIVEIKRRYNWIKELVLEKNEVKTREAQRRFRLSESEIVTLVEAFTGQRGTLENPPADAVQQHNYAEQQFNSLAAVFNNYKHIFGQNKPEIRPEKLIRDNKFLYILLPVLEVEADQVEILGKMIIMTIRQVAAIALGGEKLSQHATIMAIRKDKITPKPFTQIVLDEYGAYPIKGLDTILAQVRSLNMSVAVLIQDYASLKSSGNDITSQERALANTTKIMFKMEDDKTIEWSDKMMAEVNYENIRYDKNAHGNLVTKQDLEIEKRKVFQSSKLRDFDNGFCVLSTGSGLEGLSLVQTFFRGGKADGVMIKRYTPFEV